MKVLRFLSLGYSLMVVNLVDPDRVSNILFSDLGFSSERVFIVSWRMER